MADSAPTRRSSLSRLMKIWDRGRRRSKMAPVPTFFMRRNCVSCRVVWLYLKQNNIPFTMVDVCVKIPVDLASMSPLGSVPLLRDGELSIHGSQAIVFYLAEKFASYAGLGCTLEERAVAESIIGWAATSLLRDVGNNYVYPIINEPEDALSGGANTSLIDFGKTEVFFHLDTLEKHYLSKRKFLSGSKPTFVDGWVTVVLSLLELVPLDLQAWPKLKAWMVIMKSSGDYIDVSHDHEERVRKILYGLQNSAVDLKKTSV